MCVCVYSYYIVIIVFGIFVDFFKNFVLTDWAMFHLCTSYKIIVLSNIKFLESISPLERLVAYRRLLRFLDEHFDELRLEDSGKYWEEQTTLLVGEPRPYNTSPSALRKLRTRKKKNRHQHFETGYSFVVHHDNTVTVTIPIDFDNHELLQELLRNMEDFLQTQGTGLEGDYYSAMYGQEDSIL